MSDTRTFRIIGSTKKAPATGVAVEAIRQRLEGFLPDPTSRRAALDLMARVIRAAHGTNPASWEITVRLDKATVRLNVGRCSMVSLGPNKVSLTIWTPAAGDEVPPAEVLPVGFNSLPELAWYNFEPTALRSPPADLLRLLDRAAEAAAQKVQVTPYARHHDPAAVQYLNKELGEHLPQPNFPDTAAADLRRDLLQLVRSLYPGWQGFRDPRMVEEERTYKLVASAKARELLARTELERLIAADSSDEICIRIKTVASATNMLFLAAPSVGDLSLIHHPSLDRAAFSRELLELLHGAGPTRDRLERWTRWLETNALPNKWTLTTYLLFLVHPDREFFVKPTVAKRFLELVGLDLELGSKIDPQVYATLLDLAADLRILFEDFGPEDMIDIQGLVWVCSEVAQEKSILPSQLALVRRRIQSLADDPALAEKAHAYERARAELRESLAGILAARERGEDPTDAVFRFLLPHPAPAPAGQPPVWHHPTQLAATAPHEFEAIGWSNPDTRRSTAAALLALAEACQTDPTALDEACAQFNQQVPKGFASGSLSPLLNALRPDDYALVNNTSRSLLKELTGKKPQQPITHYPAANRATLRLIHDLDPLFAELLDVDAHPGDLVDLLAHTEASDELGAEPASELAGQARYWKIAPGEQAIHWQACLDGGYISLGWEEIGDLTGVERPEFDQRVQALVASHGWRVGGLRQLWAFVADLRPGDIVFANKGTSQILGAGEVVGPYYFVQSEIHGHRVPVRWLYHTPFAVQESSWRGTLVRLAEAKGRVYLEMARRPPPPPPPPGPKPLRPLSTIADDTGLPLATLETWVRAIRRKRQAVFYGPPGTGKTFVAQQIASHLIGGGHGFVELVQFHPAYAYEDFIQGIRPRTVNGNVTYELTAGRFMEVCRRAEQTKGVCVLIIDEINRANLARVFGELMYLLEYRKDRVPLAGGETLAVPENLYLVGTMNTADRSIALVDHALRRRFAFLELRPQYDALRRFHERAETGFDPSGLIAVLERANLLIADPHYELGISFFTRKDLLDHLEDIWTMEIVPYLEEYFFDRAEKVALLRWAKVRDEILGE